MSEEVKVKPTAGKGLSLFERGNDASLKNNYEYAIEMYLEALKLEPGNLEYRQALRAVERKQFDNEPSKVGWGAATKIKMARPKIGVAKARGKWNDVLDTCEDIFQYSPWDVHTARDAAEAAEHLKLPTLARWYLESVFKQAGESVDYFRHLAHVYELNQKWDVAINCWEKVKKLKPTDEEAAKKVKGLTASAAIARSGLDEAVRKTPTGTSGPEAAAAVQPDVEELRRQAMSPEDRLKLQIQEEPSRVGNYLELADMYKHSNRLDEAEKALATGRKATGDDPLLIEAHAEVQISRMQRAQGAWAKKSRESPHDLDAKDKLEKITLMLQEFELKEFRRRAELRPEDELLHYQFGKRLRAAGRYDEAIAEFQHGRNAKTTKVRADALYELAQCFDAKNLPKLAERNYQEALKLAEEDGDQPKVNELHYCLGCVAEKAGDNRTAEEHFNEVAANDYTYKDVAQRLENLNR